MAQGAGGREGSLPPDKRKGTVTLVGAANAAVRDVQQHGELV